MHIIYVCNVVGIHKLHVYKLINPALSDLRKQQMALKQLIRCKEQRKHSVCIQ